MFKGKRLKKIFALVLSTSIFTTGMCGMSVGAAETKTNVGKTLADSIIAKYPDPDTMTTKQWEYTNGVVLYGMNKIYNNTGDAKYLNYEKAFVDKYVGADGTINPIRTGHSLDIIQPSNLLYTLYTKTSEDKYKLCAKLTRDKYNNFPLNGEGGIWHKTNYPNQMWLDGSYMGIPFIARYGSVFAKTDEDRNFCYDLAINQLKLLTSHTMDKDKKLAYHAWDQSKTAAWANKETGVSPVIWSRAMGWYAMALVDTLEYIPRDHQGYQDLKDILQTVAEGLKNYQDPKTGLWYQVMDQGDKQDNWLETSGSAMFVYALKKAATKGYIHQEYVDVANKGWEGVKSAITYDANGVPTVHGTAPGMSVQVDYANYINKTPIDNAPHGIAAVLMAASVMEK
jgi:unsaturated rhamnogalacturonyl hydrolase